MKKLSGFDLVMAVAFGVVAVLGGIVWYYLSSQLETAKETMGTTVSNFEKYSSKEVYLPTGSNEKALQANIELLKGALDPLTHSKLQSSDNKVFSVAKQDPVAWKHDLDDRVSHLNSAAKVHGVKVPANFYYGFSRYLNTNPGDEQTTVLTKQLLGIEQVADVMIDASVKGIQSVRRTYDEDDVSGNGGGSGSKTDKDYLGGHSVSADGGTYEAYPFELEFEATTDSLRKVVNALIQSPYVFVIRTVTVQNSKLTSPLISDLDKMAGDQTQPSAADASPGAVAAAAKATRGPQFLFGGEILHIKLKIDMIEWKGVTAAEAAPSAKSRNRAPAPGSN
jgi:hypothetical protein